jgi:peroxiredoxin
MEEVPLLKALRAKYSNDAAIVGVSVDINVSRVDQFVNEQGVTWPILADGKGFDGPVPQAYHIQGTPEVFVLDRAGKIFARLESAKEIEVSLKDALARR